jgi:hypothetical protein
VHRGHCRWTRSEPPYFRPRSYHYRRNRKSALLCQWRSAARTLVVRWRAYQTQPGRVSTRHTPVVNTSTLGLC